jgi:hypothetical protein
VTSRLAIILSHNLLTVLRSLIGVYEVGSDGVLLGLGIGIIVACFQVARKWIMCRR